MNAFLYFFSPLFFMTTSASNSIVAEPLDYEDSYLKKLVRDRIPEIMGGESPIVTFHKAEASEYDYYLRKKLQEEIDEFLETPCLEEMADIVEVLDAFCHQMGTSLREMENVRALKGENRGKFLQRWIMTKKISSQ